MSNLEPKPVVKHLADSNHKPTRPLAMGEFPMSDMGSLKLKNELAEISDYYPRYNTYKVVTRGAAGNEKQPAGKSITVPRKVENPNVVAPLPKGTVVVLNWDLGFAYIDGVLNVETSKELVEDGVRPPPSLSRNGSSMPTNDPGNSGYYRFPGMPDDAVEGDWAAVTPDGNYIAALQGKECTMYGSEKAQISAFGNEGLVRTICEQFEHLSSMGMLEIKNDGGRCNLKFRAATDQLTESGGSEDQWTFHLDIGDKGDFFDMRVTGAGGDTLSRLYLSSDGRVEIMGVNGVSIINAGKSPRFEVDGDDVIRQIAGQLSEIVTGAIVQKTQSKRIAEVSEDDRTFVGHNQTLSVNNHQVHSIGGNQQITVGGGSAIAADPTNVAVMMKVLNGSYILDIGNEPDGASPVAMAGYNVFVHTGEITLGQDPALFAIPAKLSNINLNTLMKDSVALGGMAGIDSTNPALFHAMLFEPFATLMSTLFGLLDSHTHKPAWGDSSPPIVPFSQLSGSVPGIQSVRVLIGL